MIKSQTLRLSLAILALMPLPLAAQQAIDEKAESPGQQTTDDSTPVATSSKQEAPAPDGRTPPATDESPFDYRSSEKISEDLSVSFPVDI